MSELKLWQVGHEDDWSHNFVGVLVVASSEREALDLGAGDTEEPNTAEAQLLEGEGMPVPGPDESPRVLGYATDAAIYRDAGWADEEGDSPCSCCGLFGYSEIQGSAVCGTCDMCLDCAADDSTDEGPCPECELPGVACG